MTKHKILDGYYADEKLARRICYAAFAESNPRAFVKRLPDGWAIVEPLPHAYDNKIPSAKQIGAGAATLAGAVVWALATFNGGGD